MRGGVQRQSLAAASLLLMALLASLLVFGAGSASASTPHPPIFIQGDANFTAENGVVGGSGTVSDPYVISGWDIDASSSNGIEIHDTRAYLNIQDVVIHGGDEFGFTGVVLAFAQNVTVERCTLSTNFMPFFVDESMHIGISVNEISDSGGVSFIHDVTNLTFERNTLTRTTTNIVNARFVSVSGNQAVGDPNSPFSEDAFGLSGVHDGTIVGNSISLYTEAGMQIVDSSDLLVSDNAIAGVGWGFTLNIDTQIAFERNQLTGSEYGILGFGSSQIAFRHNVFSNNLVSLYVEGFDGTEFRGNSFHENGRGIWQFSSPRSTITGNTFEGDGLTILGTVPEDFASHTISADNIVNGRPILYYHDGANLHLDGTPAGEIIVANYAGVQLTHLNLNDTDAPIEIAFSSDVQLTENWIHSNWESIVFYSVTRSSVQQNEVVNNTYGIIVQASQDIVVFGNHVSSVRSGVDVFGSTAVSVSMNTIDDAAPGFVHPRIRGGLVAEESSGVVFDYNRVSDNLYGVVVTNSDHIDVLNNTVIASTQFGIRLQGSSTILVTRNNFLGNTIQAYQENVMDAVWGPPYPGGGNFWSDHAGPDDCSGPGQDVCPDPDGIVDTPYVFDIGGVDQYPFAAPTIPGGLPPVAAFSASPNAARPGTPISFDASGSVDPDGPDVALQYRWDWDGDGVFDTDWESNALAAHVFPVAGRFPVMLEVRDVRGQSDDAVLTVLVDGTPPSTTATLSGTLGADDWYLSPVLVSLDATDDLAGVAATNYRLDGGPWQSYSDAFTVADQGEHVLEFFSVDRAGNAESPRSATVKIDLSPPATTATLSGDQTKSGWFKGPVLVLLVGADSPSGVSSTWYRIDGGPWQLYVGAFTVSGKGSHTLEFYSVDVAGNTGPVRFVRFTIKGSGG